MPKDLAFTPITLQAAPAQDHSPARVTVTATLKGVAAEEFEELCSKHGLNRSQLLTQMVYHCLNRTEDLKDFYRRLAILGA